ncbi:transcription initiation factor IIB [Candidatus Nitrososphaera gargensis Ga9.2]|uniref:Transcription initiation factor IIB n=1 Tax=Nitrososphaera gargensis (strain Ga9.2) TaxID=1237085 RepID=K0IMD2_NITGG|nr:TFIIB-type zinc ribbon-containing protein [Candidatus Nitrososphaera gargensis]AFU60167.1 transcription initiation factor IIB [Candidatus Nitrososphaera gargensis Ga9.2]
MLIKSAGIICPNCGDGQKVTDVESGELICTKCGFVIRERVGNEEEDWSVLAREPGSKLRTSPTSLARSGMGLSTIIGRPDMSAGSGLNAAMRSTFDRLRAWDFRIKGQDERSLRRAFVELDRLRSALGLSDAIVEKTAYIYRRAQERGLVRGRTMRAVLGAAIYIVQREMGVSGTLQDIINATNTTEKDLARAYRILLRELDLKVPMLDPAKCVSRVASKANISERTKRKAMDMIYNVIKSGLAAGKDPMGLAASVLYIACTSSGEPKSQAAIADAAGVSEVTLRKNQRMIIEQAAT